MQNAHRLSKKEGTRAKSEESKENPAFDFRIIEPKTDTINLTKEKVFTLIIGHSGEMNSLHLIDYSSETYADLNGIDGPETNEEFLALSDEEQDKLTVIIPKHEIKKEVLLVCLYAGYIF